MKVEGSACSVKGNRVTSVCVISHGTIKVKISLNHVLNLRGAAHCVNRSLKKLAKTIGKLKRSTSNNKSPLLMMPYWQVKNKISKNLLH